MPKFGLGVLETDAREVIEDDQWVAFDDFSNWGSTVVGSGSVSQDIRLARVSTGATGSSEAALHPTNDAHGFSRGKNINVLNWSKPLAMKIVCSMIDGTANGEARVVLGKDPGLGDVADPSDKAIGIRVDDQALKGIVHNGTDLTVVDLSTTMTLDRCYDVEIRSAGDGSVIWKVDDVQKGSTGNGPTGDATADFVSPQIETENNADTADMSFAVLDLKIFVGQ